VYVTFHLSVPVGVDWGVPVNTSEPVADVASSVLFVTDKAPLTAMVPELYTSVLLPLQSVPLKSWNRTLPDKLPAPLATVIVALSFTVQVCAVVIVGCNVLTTKHSVVWLVCGPGLA